MVKMKIRIHNFTDSVGLQLFDRYYAFKQSFDTKSFETQIKIEYGPPQPDSLNIAFFYFPTKEFCNLDLYDFVFVDNAGESLEVATDYMVQLLNHKNVYFICGAFLTDDHPLKSKVIPYNHNIRLFHDCMTRGFYPQYYHRASNNYNPIKNLIFINGANRSWRRYFMDLLITSQLPVDIRSDLGKEILETPDCFFEDTHDSAFRKKLSSQYPVTEICDYDYYENLIKVGIDGKFGKIGMGYFLFDIYYQYQCVIFPETGWINNQHFATEKIYKCFVSGAIPFPLSGAKTHQLYNAHGYQTAWNLLPPDLQKFDDELDHVKRYQQIVEAIGWLTDNSEIFQSDQANSLRIQNQVNFYKNTLDTLVVEKLDLVLQTSKKYCE